MISRSVEKNLQTKMWKALRSAWSKIIGKTVFVIYLRSRTKPETIWMRERLISIVVWFRRSRTASICGVFLDGLFRAKSTWQTS